MFRPPRHRSTATRHGWLRRPRPALAAAVALTVLLPLQAGMSRPAAAAAPPVTALTAAAGADGGDLLPPSTLHADGADLAWTRYTGQSSGAPFGSYEVHRAPGGADFTPSAATLLTTIRDASTTRYSDTTAAAQATFTYKLVTNGAASAPQTVTLPASGQATRTLRPDGATGSVTHLYTVPGATLGCFGYGAQASFASGGGPGSVTRGLVRFDLGDIPQNAEVSAATLSLWETNAPLSPITTQVHRVTRPWTEGDDKCGSANWTEAAAGQSWTTPGGDYDSTVIAKLDIPRNTANLFREFPVTGVVQSWVNGTAPNNGLLLRSTDETPTYGNTVWFASDDAPDASQRPALTITYADGRKAQGPRVSLAAPSAGAAVAGEATLTAAAEDDRRVEKVEFLVDGTVVGSDTAAPFVIAWNSTAASNGAHALTVRATDDAGNTSTSAAASVTVDNSAMPAGALTAPAAGATVSGSAVTVSADASDDRGVASVAFLVDGVRVGQPDTTEPYSITWNTLDPLAPGYNGAHQVAAAVTDTSGQTTVSAARSVTVANTGTTAFKAGFTLNSPTDATDDVFPQAMTENTATGVPVQDPYAGSVNADGTSGGSLGRSLSSAPQDDAGTAPTTCPATAYCVKVNVTNTSGVTWTGSTAQVWYRWFAANGAVMFEGRSATAFPATFAANAVQTFPLTIYPPALPPGLQQGSYRLRIDVYDPATGTWFAAKGNPPVENPVLVAKALATKLGLERYYQYDGTAVGAGMSSLTNIANGNMLVRWSPFFAPGRGLATMVDLTYNSLEDHSRSPAGTNFSLSISGLTRLGEPLDIHPNKADQISGKSNKWVELTDGDGSTHHFDGVTGTDGVTRWTEPPGVNLYLRSLGGTDPARQWALTRPDKVTFYFDADGFPTSVEDRNGNKLTFTVEDTPPGEDPGGPKKRVTRVTDAGGRSFAIDYWTKDEIKKAHVRGQIQTITDHSGSALEFDYYDDGNLLRLTQRGGTKADGSFLADRSFVFTYTTSNGAGPAIPDAADRVNPAAKTPNQSSRLFSVRDPRGKETTYAYYLAPDGAQLKWKLKSRTDREGQVTGYAYDLTNRVSTVTAPLSRVTRYSYDTSGKVISIVDPANRTTGVQWSADFKVTKVTEPTGKFRSWTYNANGYPLTSTNQLNETTQLTYADSAVDVNDSGKHLSLLATVTNPKGMATTTVAGDYTTSYSYDAAGNVDKVTDPTGAVTDYDYNLAGSANPGTVSAVRDAVGNPATTFPAYDASGQPTQLRDPLGNVTQFGYDVDGLVRWIQDPMHSGDTGADVRSYRTYLDYDAFHRLGRQSSPKSTRHERGTLLWSGTDFDANDNVTRSMDPHYGYGSGDPADGAVTRIDYDNMDRATLITGPDTSTDSAGERTRIDYDAAGRTSKVTMPKGVASATTDDYAVSYGYDPLDRIVRQTQYGTSTSQARVTQMCYDLAGDLRSVTSPRQGSAAITCPGNGPAVADYTTETDYDAAHRVKAQRDELGHAQRVDYDANGNVIATEQDIASGRAQRTETDYDQRDLPVTVRERFDGATARNVVAQLEYDKNGNRTKLTSPRAYDVANGATPSFYVTVQHYDALNRPVRTDLPFDSRDGTERQYTHNAYDPNGRLAWTSLPTTVADAAGVGAGAKTVLDYFDPGWIRTSDDPANPKVHFDYTAQGWQAQRQPEKKSSPGALDENDRMFWTYYVDGMLKTRTDKGGQINRYTYDAHNNLLTGFETGVTDSEEKEVETQASYTGFDEPAKVRHRKQSATAWTFTDYGYDLNGNITLRRENGEESDTGTQSKAPRRFELSYDGADWLTEQLDLGTDSACKGDSRTVNAFWSTGWEKQRDIYRAGASCTADPTAWPKKQTTTWTHFDNGKLRTLLTRNGSGTTTESHDVGYFDPNGDYVNGNRTTDRYVLTRAEGNTDATCLAAAPCDAKYTYDARDRLISHQLRAGKTDSYTLDEPGKLIGDTTVRAGNITTEVKNGTTTSKRYTGNQLTDITVGGAIGKYWYDDWGNLDCLTLAAGSQADCSPSELATPSSNLITDYGYDYLNRLTGLRQYSGGTRTDKTKYVYDALDRTTLEDEDHSGTGNDRKTTFAYQGLTSLATEERQSGGTNPRTRTFSYDSYGHRTAMTDQATGSTAEPNQYTYGTDVHSSVSQLIDDAGKVKASYGYDAYGGADPQLTTGDTDNLNPINPYRFSNKRIDTGTAGTGTTPSAVPNGSGGYDMGARRYGPDTSRFLQQDMFAGSLGDLGLGLDPLTQNRYALAGGNPISYIETDGHMVAADGGGGGSTSPNPTTTSTSSGGSNDSAGDQIKRTAKTAWNDIWGGLKGTGNLVKESFRCEYTDNQTGCKELNDQLKHQYTTAEGWKQTWNDTIEPIKKDCTSTERAPECGGHVLAAVGEALLGKGLGKAVSAGKHAPGGATRSSPTSGGGPGSSGPPAGRPDGEEVLSGHGGQEAGAGKTRVPKGTCVAMYCDHGDTILDSLGNDIETGAPVKPVQVYKPGQFIQDYTLYPPTGLNIMGNPTTVTSPTRLSQLLQPNMGMCHWAACREAP
ncbi:DNRLRE domain-containing protein [Micromonospora terminaliae]|uniref:DNRLRE domain-containing protein n=1 Tax=Micromonospora terminaliae TaxID=1914461 RepID=A0AAJ2ZD49_9ACTN|nr:Ig-like domain-containing protein [Micromonospora terminaliae]NES27985.1 DNRLRE domain-containing protein [Micromonospora terminaliae]QGL47253.1 DNRLRE domain-containing protein [Micromonospora terminaliae]